MEKKSEMVALSILSSVNRKGSSYLDFWDTYCWDFIYVNCWCRSRT